MSVVDRIVPENPGLRPQRAGRTTTVQMNTSVSPEIVELRQELAERLGWTHRRVLETALKLLAEQLGDVP